jgi:hypothetical protein
MTRRALYPQIKKANRLARWALNSQLSNLNSRFPFSDEIGDSHWLKQRVHRNPFRIPPDQMATANQKPPFNHN